MIGNASAFKSTFCILLNPILNSSSSLYKVFLQKVDIADNGVYGMNGFCSKSRPFTCTNLTRERIHGSFFFFFFFFFLNLCMRCPDWVEIVHPAENKCLLY